MGFVEDFLLLSAKRARSSPIEYSEATALWVLASAINRSVWTQMNWGHVFPNIYVLVVGRSTISHKTTAVNPGIELMTKVYLSDMLPMDFSPEGLFTVMSNRRPAVGYMALDDVGGLLGKMKTRDYMTDAKDLLMRFWNCEAAIIKTLRKDHFVIHDSCVSVIATITPERFMEVMDESDLKDGFLARFLVVYPESVPSLPATWKDGYQTQMENDLAQTLMHVKNHFQSGYTLQLQLRGPALARYTDWVVDLHEQIKTGEIESSMAAIASRADTYAIKLAQLYQMSDLVKDLSSLHGVSALAIDENAMKRAIKWLEVYLDGAHKFVDMILMPPGAEQVKQVVWANPGIGYRDLLLVTRKPPRVLKSILDFWTQREEVEQKDDKAYYPSEPRKECLSCKAPFKSKRVDALYCSSRCRKRVSRARNL